MSQSTESLNIPWRRFWIPLDNPIQLAHFDQEFLPDPEDRLLGKLNRNVAPLETWSGKSTLVLCGDPGLGKSTELRGFIGYLISMKSPNDHTITIDFRDVPSEGVFSKKTLETPVWKQWRGGTGKLSLLIDSLDEGLLKIPGFLRYLRAEIASEPIERLQLVLACRSADWPRSEGSHLLSLWPSNSYELLELCPLTRKDFELASALLFTPTDAALFRRTVFEHCLSELASRPITLFFLLDEFKPGEGLPGSHRELYERVTSRLARETDKGRAEVLRSLRRTMPHPTDALIFQAATRIAAALILCGRSALAVGDIGEVSLGDIHFSELADSLPCGVNFIPEQTVFAAASSALFTSRGRNRFGFAHQTLAECLTAKFVAKMPLRQILSLLCGSADGETYVIPQLSQTAAWLAVERSDFLEYVLAHDPAVLLRTDVSKISEIHKEKLIAALLVGAKNEKIFDDNENRRFFRALKHRNLPQQLRAVIRDKTSNRVVRRLAADIGRDCKLQDVSRDYLAVLYDSTDAEQVRDHCAYALEVVLPDAEAAEMIPFALGRVPPDRDDSIRGCALRKLVPNVWSVGNSVRALRRPQKLNLYGSYQAVLRYHLPKHVTEKELPVLLGWLICWRDAFDELHWLHALADRVFSLSLSRLSNPRIKTQIARMWILKQRRNHEFPNSDRSESFRVLQDSDEVRRNLISAIVESPMCCDEDVDNFRTFRLQLLKDKDIEWVLFQAQRKNSQHRLWAAILSLLISSEYLPAHWDAFVDLLESSPELRARVPWLRAWNLNEKIAVEAKAQWEQQREFTRRNTPKPEPPSRELLHSALRDCETDPQKNWPLLCRYLHINEGPPRYWDSYQDDLTRTPGWRLLAPVEQERVLAAGKAFICSLAAVQEVSAALRDPICHAIWLFRSDLASDDDLKKIVRAKCLPALFAHLNGGSEIYQEYFRLAYDLDSNSALKWFKLYCEGQAKEHSKLHGLHGFSKAWNSTFSSTLAEILRDSLSKPDVLLSGFAFFGKVDQSNALAVATELLSSPSLRLEDRAAISAGILYSAPQKSWDLIWPDLAKEDGLARASLTTIASSLDHHGRRILPCLSEEQLGELYFRIMQLFPSDEPPDSEDSTVTPERAVLWFRNDVISTLGARSNRAAVRVLRGLAERLPKDRIWLRWRARDTEAAKRRQEWTPPEPKQLLRLQSDENSRFVKDIQDLQDLVLDSLERLENRLVRQDIPRFEDLWKWTGADPNRLDFEPKEENYLTNYMADWLRTDLKNRGLFIGRELQVRIGQRTDIQVVAACPNPGGSLDTLNLVVEVKGCWNRDVQNALSEQLVGRYLRPNGFTHGVFVIGWYLCDKWKKPRNRMEAETFEEARKEAAEWAKPFDGIEKRETVRSFLLDCRYLG